MAMGKLYSSETRIIDANDVENLHTLSEMTKARSIENLDHSGEDQRRRANGVYLGVKPVRFFFVLWLLSGLGSIMFFFVLRHF